MKNISSTTFSPHLNDFPSIFQHTSCMFGLIFCCHPNSVEYTPSAPSIQNMKIFHSFIYFGHITVLIRFIFYTNFLFVFLLFFVLEHIFLFLYYSTNSTYTSSRWRATDQCDAITAIQTDKTWPENVV